MHDNFTFLRETSGFTRDGTEAMPTPYNINLIHIGNFADLDTDESDANIENANVVVGDHTSLQLLPVTTIDQDNSNAIEDDEFGSGDTLNYDAGSGMQTTQLDSSSVYNAELLLGDGTTISSMVVVLQGANGDVFIGELLDGDLDGLDIQSIELTSVQSSNYSGIGIENHSIDDASVVCLCYGVRISTPGGDVRVENLRVGDMVNTLDHGPRPIVWTDQTVSAYPGRNAPIQLTPGCLGENTSKTPLLISPQHRVLLRSRIARRMFGTPEILIPARSFLKAGMAVQRSRFLPTFYYHFACEEHEIVSANGTQVETFFPGAEALKALSPAALAGLKACNISSKPARPMVKGKMAINLLRRHAKVAAQ